MRLILTSVAASALLATGLAGSALAHGGSYRGPAGEVPPDSREPSDPPPPPDGGGPGTPGGNDPGGPTTGGGDGVGPTTGGGDGGGAPTGGGGGGPGPGGGGGGGPTTGGGVGKKVGGNKGPGYEDWTFWWNFNKDEILNLKSIIKLNQRGAPTGSGAHALGHGTGTKVQTATDAMIASKIVPALRELMDQKDLNFDIQSAAELALAKIGDETIIESLMKIARNDGKDGKFNKVVEESAALALGLLQKDTPEIREFLIELMKDKKRNSSFIRPFSAVSLGLLGSANDKDNQVPAALMEIVNGDESKEDIKPAALLALGLLKNDSQCETLLGMLKSGKSADGKVELADNEVAFVVQALGKIGRPGLDKVGSETAILDTITAQVDEKSKAEKNVRRSAAIALGSLAQRCDVKTQKAIVNTLKKVIDKTEDAQERHFALIALGRIGSSSGVDKEMRGDCIKSLNYYLDKGKGLTPPFAAMGLGLIGRRMSADNEVPDEELIRKPLREHFLEAKDAKTRGAYAVASGLVRDRLAVEELIKVLQGSKNEAKLRGYSALALGMIGDGAAKDAIHTALTNDSDRELRVQTAVAAGLMGDASVVKDLVKLLESGEESQYILGSVALALGQLGDENAIEPLLAIAKDDKKYPDLTRALATVALGQIGDRRDVPTLARVATDINYRAQAPALTELLTIL